MAGEEYKYVGDHAQDLESGTVLAPGETVTLDEKGVYGNQALIEEGALVPMADLEALTEEGAQPAKATPAKSRKASTKGEEA